MDLLHKLESGPIELFDYVLRAERDGYVPGRYEVIEEYGDEFDEWTFLFPEERVELIGELDDERFITMEDLMNEAGYTWKDFE